MARTKPAIKKQPARAPELERLGPGLHAVTIDLRTDTDYRVRTLDGKSYEVVGVAAPLWAGFMALVNRKPSSTSVCRGRVW